MRLNNEQLGEIIERPSRIISINELIAAPTQADVHAVIEFDGIGASHKDRPVANMFREINAPEILRTNTRARFGFHTTGTAGISAAKIGGENVTIFMPENITAEREQIIRETGAELILSPADCEIEATNGERQVMQGQIWVQGALRQLLEWADSDPNHHLLNQSSSPYNPTAFHGLANQLLAHFQDGRTIDYLVVGSGTSATLVGLAQVFSIKSPKTKIVGVDVKQSPQTHAEIHGYHLVHDPSGKIPGFGPGAASPILKQHSHLINEVERVSPEAAMQTAQELLRKGMGVGLSSAANLVAVRNILSKLPDKRIVTIFFDKADRYRSIGLV